MSVYKSIEHNNFHNPYIRNLNLSILKVKTVKLSTHQTPFNKSKRLDVKGLDILLFLL